MSTPHSQLHDLLLSLFAVDELRRWIRYDPRLAVLANGLPGPTASAARVVDDAVAGMDRRGLIDAALFAGLRDEYPGRARDVDRVAQLWEGRDVAPTTVKPPGDAQGQASTVNVYHGGVHISGEARVSTGGDIIGGDRNEE